MYKPLTADLIPTTLVQVNVSQNFEVLLKLYLLYFTIGSCINGWHLYEYSIHKTLFPNIVQMVKWFNDFLAIYSLVLLHAYRLSHGGKVCSGQYAYGQDREDAVYLLMRGKLLFVHLVIIWVVLLCMGVVTCVYKGILRKPISDI